MKPMIGQTVRFKSASRSSIWGLRDDAGIVVAVRQFGPTEAMVTARFGNVTVHTSHIDLIVMA